MANDRVDELLAALSAEDRRAVVEHMARINLILEHSMSETDRMIVETVIKVLSHPGGIARRLKEQLRELLKDQEPK